MRLIGIAFVSLVFGSIVVFVMTHEPKSAQTKAEHDARVLADIHAKEAAIHEAQLKAEQRERDKAASDAERERKRVQEETYGDHVTAKLMAEDMLTERLKYPDDVSFAWLNPTPELISSGGGKKYWKATGKATAKNGLGLPITQRFVVTLYKSSPKLWSPLLVQLGDEVLYVGEREPSAAEHAAKEAADAALEDEQARAATMLAEKKRRASEAAAANEDDAKWHHWKSADGKFDVDAKFIRLAIGKVRLEKRDGTTIEVDMAALSDDDQKWITSQGWKKP